MNMTAPEEFDLDIGHDHYLAYQYRDGQPVGALVWHPHHGRIVAGGVHWVDVGAGPVWDAQHVGEPNITISPSIHCMDCGDHGFVREGKWVPA